ncbi:hypothetical protein DRQ36_04075 [bacterium]|nr:MAG: hypothetical protein DRQ36_04075 [bacterium]
MGELASEINSRFNQYSRLLLRRRRLFYAAIGLPLLFTILFTSLATPSYKAVGRLLPTSDVGNMGVIGILTGLFGSRGTQSIDGAPSSFLYVDILKSRTVVENVLNAEYTFYHRGKSVSGDLYKVMHWPRDGRAIESFLNISSAKMDLETGVITITAKAYNPVLAAQIVNNWIRQLDSFNRNVRITQAGENLEYLEKRLTEAKAELDAVSDTLVEYLNANRGYPEAATPEVTSMVRRLENQRDIKETVYQLLSQEYEMAKLTKRKTTPVVSVMDTAVPPAEKAGPKRIPVFAISLFFASIILAVSLAILEASDDTPKDLVVRWFDVKTALKDDLYDLASIFRRHR